MCIWNSWKNVKAKVPVLKKWDALDWQAYQLGNTHLGYWCVEKSRLVTSIKSDDELRKAG